MGWSKHGLAKLMTAVAGTLLMQASYAQGPGQPMRGAPAAPPPSQPSIFAPAPASATPQPLSMLQQPAQAARIVFTNNSLAIHAENSSLAELLHQFAEKSGMQITGLGNDERVFGNFGPGAPRDVLADLLNGTAYNQVLLGDLSNGAPRELILTPTTHADVAAAVAPQAAAADEPTPEPEPVEAPPQPEVSPAPTTPPPPQGRTPQQLFEQLQQMRQQQQQQQQQTQP